MAPSQSTSAPVSETRGNPIPCSAAIIFSFSPSQPKTQRAQRLPARAAPSVPGPNDLSKDACDRASNSFHCESFDAGQTAYGSEMWSDETDVASVFQRNSYSNILLRATNRLAKSVCSAWTKTSQSNAAKKVSGFEGAR